MSSGFVSGGTNDLPLERDAEWIAAQEELEAQRRAKEDVARQNGGKSLYEVLQANKAKKQEAFEESIKLKNQFRALDEDEAEFLDSVLESTRAQEATLKRETTQQLDAFRKHQEDLERAARFSGTNEEESSVEKERWDLVGRKRKRIRDKEALVGIKIRRTPSTSSRNVSIPTAKGNTGALDSVADGKGNIAAGTPCKANDATRAPAMTSSNAFERRGGAVWPNGHPGTEAQNSKTTPVARALIAYSSDEDE